MRVTPSVSDIPDGIAKRRPSPSGSVPVSVMLTVALVSAATAVTASAVGTPLSAKACCDACTATAPVTVPWFAFAVASLNVPSSKLHAPTSPGRPVASAAVIVLS